jgi:predicted ArsR family transcriptional regulator
MGITEETRRANYYDVAPKISRMEEKVLSILREHGRQTAEEIMRRMGTNNPNNVRPRLTNLKKRGLVLDVDKCRDADGHVAAVWEARDA